MPRNAIIGLVVTIFLAAAIGAGVFLTNQQQTLKSRASGLVGNDGGGIVSNAGGYVSIVCDMTSPNQPYIRVGWSGQPTLSNPDYYDLRIQDFAANGDEVARVTTFAGASNFQVTQPSTVIMPKWNFDTMGTSGGYNEAMARGLNPASPDVFRPVANNTYQVVFAQRGPNEHPIEVAPVTCAAPAVPTASLTVNGASSVTIPYGGTFNAAWSSTNATECHASPATTNQRTFGILAGTVSINGNVTSQPVTQPGTYSISLFCVGGGGSSNTSTVSVTVQNQPITPTCAVGSRCANDSDAAGGLKVPWTCYPTSDGANSCEWRKCNDGTTCPAGYSCDSVHCVAQSACAGQAAGYACPGGTCNGAGTCIASPVACTGATPCGAPGACTAPPVCASGTRSGQASLTCDTSAAGCPASPPVGGSLTPYCRVRATTTANSRVIALNYGAGDAGNTARVSVWLKKVDGTPLSSNPDPAIRHYTANGFSEYEIDRFDYSTTAGSTNGVTCTGASCSTNLNVTLPDNGDYVAYCAVGAVTGSSACSGNPNNAVTSCTKSGGDPSLTPAFSVSVNTQPPACTEPAPCGTPGACTARPTCSTGTRAGQASLTCDTNPAGCPATPPSDPPPPPPSDPGTPVTEMVPQSCNMAGIGSGTMYCEGARDAAGVFTPTNCYVDQQKSAPGCGFSLSGISCTANPNQIAVGGTTTWKVSYPQSISATPQVVFNNDSRQGTSPSGRVLNGSSYEITNPSQTYSTPGAVTPNIVMKFGSAGQTAPISCSTLAVGNSSLKSTVSVSPAAPKTGQEVTITAGATESSTDANVSVKAVEIFVNKESGAEMTEAECGAPLTNGKCRLGGRTDLSGDKTVSNIQAKWTPKVNGRYIVYSTALSSTGAACSGARNSSGVYPCGNEASKELIVGQTLATTKYRLATEANTFDICALGNYNPDGTYKEPNSTCPVIYDYGNNPSKLISAYPSQGWTEPGVKTVFVEFIRNDGTTQRSQKSITLVEPDPELTGVACSLDLTGKTLNVTAYGSNFGTKANNSSISLNESAAKVTKWDSKRITATAAAPAAGSTGDYDVTVKRSDGQTASLPCRVGTSQLSVGARSYCSTTTAIELNNVDLTIVEATKGAKPVSGKVKIDKTGVVQGLNVTLQAGRCYKLSIKAPNSVRKTVEFQATEGTTGLPNFKIPVGDIFPIGGDGKINTNDRSEIIRQWSASDPNTKGIVATSSASTLGNRSSTNTSTARTGDFNLDNLINNFDFACMIRDFNSQDDSAPVGGPVSDPTLRSACENPDQFSDNQGEDL